MAARLVDHYLLSYGLNICVNPLQPPISQWSANIHIHKLYALL